MFPLTLRSLLGNTEILNVLKSFSMMATPKAILLACGSFNPPTMMHLRMFELARDHCQECGICEVIGGVMSPVHDGYKKQDLVPSPQRNEMVSLAVENSSWIRLSRWESQRECWSRTREVLEYHQNKLNSIHTTKRRKLEDDCDDLKWLPDLSDHDGSPIQVKLLCGGDLLESFSDLQVWAEEDIEAIVKEHGLVVITREGSHPQRFIYESDILNKHKTNIHIVTEWMSNDISATKVRRAIRRNHSIKYLTSDSVISYINQNGLYSKSSSEKNKYESDTTIILTPLSHSTSSTDSLLTPSPVDVHMVSPTFLEVPEKRIHAVCQRTCPTSCISDTRIECPHIPGVSVKVHRITRSSGERLEGKSSSSQEIRRPACE